MIVIDDTWERIDDNFYYRKSPVQPNSEKLTYFQFFKVSIARITEVVIPTINNRKELERVALERKWISRRNKLEEYLQDNPNCLNDYMHDLGKEIMRLEYNYPTFMKHPNGNFCYERYSLSTDNPYYKGMKVIVDLHTEEIYMKHFDNVAYNAFKKGYTGLSSEDALKSVTREIRIDKILN